MSDTRTNGVSIKPLLPKVKDAAILKEAALFLGWIAALVIIAGICWSLTGPVRSRLLVNAVNKVLEQSGDSRRLVSSALPSASPSALPSASPASPPAFSEAQGSFSHGAWYNMTNGTRVFIFGFIGDGTFFPCAAVMSSEGKVQEFIPLNDHGKRAIEMLPAGILKINARRVEGARL